MNTLALATPLRTLADLPSPPGLPLLGHLHRMQPAQVHRTFERWLAEQGPMLSIRLGRRHALLSADTDLLHGVLRERPERFRRRRTIEAVLAEMGANGVFSVEGEAWRPQRQIVMRSLAATHFRAFFPLLHTITERLRRRWAEAARRGEVLEMRDELTRYTVDVTTALAFGEDPNTIDGPGDRIQEHLALIFPMLMERSIAPFPYWRYLKLPRDRRLDRAVAAVHAHVEALIDRAQWRRRGAPGEPRNLLEALLAANEAEGGTLSREDVVANVITLLLAGEDTTAHSLAWSLFYLAGDPALQDRLSREAEALFGDARLCREHEQVKQLDAFEAVATEATRLRPVVPMFGLEPVVDVELGGLALPRGTPMFFMLRPAMLDARRFADPQRFDPQRWQRAPAGSAGPAAAGCPHAATRAHDARAWLQFGTGPRVCPGRHLAGVEMRLVLSMLARNFRVQLACEPAQVHEVMSFTMHPQAMPVRLALRA
ncbi:MAG: cytochrome P450 [Piscinibacter sp.]|uniref:cytochrome P450 n=1 Tax=Piscinibacter TaxID=1114981 RepID=UPI000FDCDFD0|nr:MULTISPECIES: cytochrome P450 [Piscinibacter]MCW5666789.1 cytochrome P450 [Piscinibacter sp.]